MQKSDKQLELEKAVKKEQRRIKQYVSRATKKGYSFSSKAIPELPKKITEATLRKFKSYTPEKIMKTAVYTSPTGTEVKGAEKKPKKTKTTVTKAKATRKSYYKKKKIKDSEEPASTSKEMFMTIEDLMYHFSYRGKPSWSDELQRIKHRDISIMRNALSQAIARDGKESVTKRINEQATQVYAIIDNVIYGSGESYHTASRDGDIPAKIQEFVEIVKGGALTVSESIELTELGNENETYELPL